VKIGEAFQLKEGVVLWRLLLGTGNRSRLLDGRY
jgi:hypothetical protein